MLSYNILYLMSYIYLISCLIPYTLYLVSYISYLILSYLIRLLQAELELAQARAAAAEAKAALAAAQTQSSEPSEASLGAEALSDSRRESKNLVRYGP